MHPAPLTAHNNPSCVYSAQGNMICGERNAETDPILTIAPRRCAGQSEHYVNGGTDWQKSLDSMKQGVGNLFNNHEHFLSDATNQSIANHGAAFKNSAQNAIQSQSGTVSQIAQSWANRKAAPQQHAMSNDHFVNSGPTPMNTAMNLSYSVSPWPF